MARYLFSILTYLYLLTTCYVQAITGVEDVAANYKLLKILTASESALTQATETVNNLQEMNTVLGNQLPAGLLNKLSQFSGLSTDLGGLMGGLAGDGGDPLRSLNDMGQQYGRSRDYRQFLAAKDYFKNKYFAQPNQSLSLTQSATLQNARENDANEAVVSAIALSDQQVKGLQAEHAQLVEMSKTMGQSDTLNYQLNMQTRLMQKMIILLERIALTQSKLLDLQAKQYLREQPVINMHKGRP